MLAAYHLSFNLCFLSYQDEILMLLRKKEPNANLWNGVGGLLEIGETPYQSMLREIYEEPGRKNGSMISRDVRILPEWVDIHQSFQLL